MAASNHRWIWILSASISILLLGAVIWQIQWNDFPSIASGIDWRLFLIAIALLVGEGFATSARLRHFTRNEAEFSAALKCNAWYSVLLIALPARLGEVAAIKLFQTYLNQPYGAAGASIVSQRLFDLVVLCGFFCLAIIGFSGLVNSQLLLIIGLAIFGGVIFLLFNLHWVLTLAIRFTKQLLPNARKILGLLFQARRWIGLTLTPAFVPYAIGITVAKWALNLSAIALLLMSLRLELGAATYAAIAAAYNFFAIIPVQTIGGLGIGESALTAMLSAVAIPLSMAASASIVARIALIVSPLLFACLVFIISMASPTLPTIRKPSS